MKNLILKDTTFRDGEQGFGAKVTNPDFALDAIRAIAGLGVGYLEVGFASRQNAPQLERIAKASEMLVGQARVCGFGRTHPEDVEVLTGLHERHGMPAAALVGKSRVRDAERALRKTPTENVALISDSVSQLKEAGLEVIYDAEHFFDGMREDAEYTLPTLAAAVEFGADWLVLCDTNGGSTTSWVAECVKKVRAVFPNVRLGVHTHNDRGRAIGNAEAAWLGGCELVEGTIGGVGERVGNMDLITFLANAVHDYGVDGELAGNLSRARFVYIRVCDALNIPPRPQQQWVGDVAFYTEAGMHASGELRDGGGYLHAEPGSVGNRVRFGVTEQSGRANLVLAAEELGIRIPDERLGDIAAKQKAMSQRGEDFGEAEATLHMFLLSQLGVLPEYFDVRRLRVIHEFHAGELHDPEASLKMAGGELHNADGEGPVSAMMEALKASLAKQYPETQPVKLTNYGVTIVDAYLGVHARVRVLVSFTDGERTWSTMSVHGNILHATWVALEEGLRYAILTKRFELPEELRVQQEQAV